jgi:hypothetical protein
MARSVWALADEGITDQVCMNEDTSAKQWLFAMIESLSREDFAQVAVTLWATWYARRKIIYDDEYQIPLSTHLFIERYLRDLAIAIPSKGTNKGVPAPEVDCSRCKLC